MQAVVRALAPAARGAGRRAASSGPAASAVRYQRYGDISKVCAVESVAMPDKLGEGEVLVKMIAAPITEFDASFISGFGAKRAGTVLPATGGNEGLGIVQGVGAGVSGFSEGDHVVPTVSGVGTWATHTVAAADHLAVVAAPSADNEMSAVMMAAGAGAPALATALLQFASLSDGDVVVQTAAHSAVGQVVTQMAAERGVAVINIVPDHTEFEDIAQHLSALNPAGFTVRENTARSPQFAKLLSDLPAASLVIDGAGGAAAISAAGALRAGGTLVSYANASRKPIVMPMAQILERGIVVRGFNLDGWAREVSVEERSNLAKTCAEASAAGKYSQLLKTENFGDWTHALAAATDATSTRRVVMVMQ
ncbi:hypothetical protein FNF27_00517 [Cafeteria roenbergensis]|uniref:enoyl-[acyl-carrier-protein] reductase n=1 Tax=Cafeteria roenbergensis TaxID=33653 RepID=A0A5A8DJ74_CAFRO|nr:hypothetical protein FNF29_00176 [Cafeteria roenbergensis]KAA0165553.1 hypothetical protein FNF31_01898 [Cafeteria roenbergensis]KAA0177969.1 hypothetical protein FNF27_00517 [Cafeteria roenbergensis]|eukprot:KAA0157600.1 hypothetical protein FNF29_00176 [Cafeteria roenbergensis]